MIFDYLIPKLKEFFPNRGLRVEISPETHAIFPCVHPEVGDIEIHDDGDELTVYAGYFTHGHFSNYDEKLSKEQKAEKIAEDVVEFLKNLFADQIVLWVRTVAAVVGVNAANQINFSAQGFLESLKKNMFGLARCHNFFKQFPRKIQTRHGFSHFTNHAIAACSDSGFT